MAYYPVLLFIVSSALMWWMGSVFVGALTGIAKFLRLREFVVAFFVVSLANSLPNLLVDVSAALHKIPQLSFGDIVGGNVVDLTLVAALAVLMTRGERVSTESRMVQTSTVFTAITAILPLLLIVDGNLSRVDGIILLLAFFVYVAWLFSKEERFRKIYDGEDQKLHFWDFFKNLGKIIVSVALLLLASKGIIDSAQGFSQVFGVSLAKVGILLVGLGNAFPETYFSIISARKGQSWMTLGDLMGSVIICATLVLGIVALVAPFSIADFSPFFMARIFLIAAALIFWIVLRSGKSFSKREGLVLLFLYFIFVISEILVK